MNWKVKACIVAEAAASGGFAAFTFKAAYHFNRDLGIAVACLVFAFLANRLRNIALGL